VRERRMVSGRAPFASAAAPAAKVGFKGKSAQSVAGFLLPTLVYSRVCVAGNGRFAFSSWYGILL